MNINNSIIYFLFGIIILSIIILIILIFESESNESNLNETNLNEFDLNSKSSCPIHNPKFLQIGLGTIGLSGILILSNKYFNIKSGGKSKSIIKKGKIKKLILGSNPVDPNIILDDTYIGNKIKRLKDENIEIIKLLKYINIIPDLPNDMDYYYTQENNKTINILNEYKKAFNSNNLYPKLIECYKTIIKKRISELKQEINEGLLKSDKFINNFKTNISKSLTMFNQNVFNRDELRKNEINIIKKSYKGNILNDNIFKDDRNDSFNSVKDLGLNDFSLYKTRLQEIYQYQNRLQNITGGEPVKSKFDKIPKSTTKLVDNKSIKQKITDEQKEEFNKTVINTSISEDQKQQINEEINQIEIQNIDINPIYLYPEDNKDSDNNIITDLNNKEITYDSLINEFINFNILKDEFITYKIMFDNCSNETVGHLEIMSEYIYELSYKLFKLFIRNSCEYFELNTKNDKCKKCFTLINSELSLLRNQLNQSIKNYNTMNQKNKELEKLNLQLSEQNVEFNNKIESLEQTKDEYINNNAELKVKIKNLNDTIDQNNVIISELKQKNTELSSNNEQKNEDINKLNKKIQDLNNLNDQSNSEIKKLNGKIDTNNDKIKNLENQIIELKNQMQESSKITQEEINKFKNQIIELKNQHNKEILELQTKHEIKESDTYNYYTNQLKDIKTRYNDNISSIKQSTKEEKEKFEKSIEKLSKENGELQIKNVILIEENNKLKQNVSLSNDISDKIITTITNDIQSILNIINKYKNEINDLKSDNKNKINEFKQQLTNSKYSNYIKIEKTDYNNILNNLKSILLELLKSLDNKDKESNIKINDILQIISSILENTEIPEKYKPIHSKIVKNIVIENKENEDKLELQDKKDILLNLVKELYNTLKKNKIDLEKIIKELNKEKYFNNSTQLLQDLNSLDVYNEDNIYNLNIFSEYLNKFFEGNQWSINLINTFKNTYIKNYVTNIILQIRLYSQIIILNNIFKFVSSLKDSLNVSPLNLEYFNNNLNKIKFKSKYQFNTIIGNQDNGLKGKFIIAETDENVTETDENITKTNSTETLSYNDLVDNILKFLEVGNITETDLGIDIPIKYYDIEDQLLDNKFKTINQHLSGFMNLLINKLTKLDIIKDKENIVKDIIDDSNNLINNINNKYQNEIIRLNDELNKQNELNNEFNKNTNNILAEYEKIIINGYNNFIIYGKQYTNKVKDLIIKEKNINKYNKEEYNNKKQKILENILSLINLDPNFSINNINPIKNYEDLINLLIEFAIYIDVLLELNNKFIEQILNENTELQQNNIELENLIKQKNKEIEEIKNDNNILNDKYNILLNQIESLKIIYDKKIQELINSNQQDLYNKIQDLSSIQEKLQKLIDEKSNIINKLKESNLIDNLKDNDNLLDIINNLIVELTQNRKNIFELSNLNTKLTKEHNLELEELINKHKLELENLNKSKEELINKLTEEINKLKTNITNKNINIIQYKTKIEILENAKIKLLTENKELSNKIVILENQLTENNIKIIQLENEQKKYDETILENSILNDKINQLIEENNKLTSEKKNLLEKMEKELTILKDEISNENIQKETNINTLKNIIKNNTLLVITLNIKNKRLNEQIIKLQQENEEYKNKQLEIIKEKELNNIESIKKYNELEKKYNLNLNELGQIKEIVNEYNTKLSEALYNNKLTIEEKEKLAIEIVQLKETNLLLNEELIQQKNLIEQKKELLKQKEEMIVNKSNKIEELKNIIKNININQLNDLKNKDQDLKNKEKELLILKQQQENIIKQIKQENFKLEFDLKKQIVQLSKEKDTLNLSIQNLTTNNTNLTTELDNLKKLQENEIQELTQKLLQLQTENGTLKSTIENLNKENTQLNKEIEECIANKNNISTLTTQLNECNKLKESITNTLTNKITELEQTNNNNNANKDAKIAELTSLLALNNSVLKEKEKKIEELNVNQLELDKGHVLAITNLTNEFNKIKEQINNENLQNNKKLILDLNKQCEIKINELENTITNLTKIGNESNLNIESKINEINKLKESYKIESENLKKQNIVYYFKNLRLSTIIQNLNNNIEQLKNDNTTNINNLTDKEKLITELNTELDRIKRILEDLEKEKEKMNSKYQNEFNNCKKELENCNNNLNECTNKFNNCNNDRNSKENLIEQYKNQLGLQDNKIEEMQKDNQALQERLNKLNNKLKISTNEEISKLSEENQKLVKENQDLQNQLNSLKTSTSTSIPVGTPASTYSLPPIIDEYAYYSNHPYITKKSTKLIENIPDNDAYSKFIKKTRNELIV